MGLSFPGRKLHRPFKCTIQAPADYIDVQDLFNKPKRFEDILFIGQPDIYAVHDAPRHLPSRRPRLVGPEAPRASIRRTSSSRTGRRLLRIVHWFRTMIAADTPSETRACTPKPGQ